MDTKLESPGVTRPQIGPRPAMYLRTLASEPWDSGFDSDEPSPLRPSLQLSDDSSDEELLDNMITDTTSKEREPLKEMNDGQQESLDILIKWRQNGDMHESSVSQSNDRSSPPLYEVELTASDEDDDASVLELVIPMQSRYQRVPTSSPKKSKPKSPTLLSSLFCCMRK